MRDLYLGDLIDGECYETFDERIIYIDKVHEHHCAVYERERAESTDWRWNLRTVSYLRRNIRTIMEVI